jgi:two-component system, cell cycle response regulator
LRILVAEDDPISRLLITRFLGVWGYETVTAVNGEEAWQIVQQENAPEMLILDWNMPGMDGIEICRRVRACSDGPYRYVLLLTARAGRDDLVHGLEAGADDYVTKPLDAAALKARLTIGRRILDLQQRLVLAAEQTRFEASHDSLTGIWNRAAILEFLRGQFSRASRDGISLALAVADIDFFKKVNDTFGHVAGDVVLREVARRLRQSLRPYDWVGRYGGEEFLIIAPDCTLANGFATCERLRSVVGGKPFDVGGQAVNVTMSFGVATSAETGALDDDGLIRAADAALYLAKEHGRNRVEMARRMPRARTEQLRPTPPAKHKELVQ